MFQYYYNQTIRKLTLAFGGLFDEIFIENKKSDGTLERTNVPLTYSAKEKFVRRLTEPSSISNNVKLETVLPILAFNITNIQYDSERHLSKLNTKLRGDGSNTYSSYSGAPYNIQFGLYSFTRNIEDNLQIMEQILPYFTPEFIVTLKLNELDKNVDVPIVLNNVGISESYEGDMMTRRAIMSSYTFTAKAYVYGKIKTPATGIIKEADVTIFEDRTL